MSTALKRRDKGFISQAELKAFYYLEEQYHDAKSRYLAKPDSYELELEFVEVRAEYRANRDRLMARLSNGATQAPGKWALRPKVFYRRRVAYKQVVIDLKGEQYVARLLANAPQKRYTRLQFAEPGENV